MFTKEQSYQNNTCFGLFYLSLFCQWYDFFWVASDMQNVSWIHCYWSELCLSHQCWFSQFGFNLRVVRISGETAAHYSRIRKLSKSKGGPAVTGECIIFQSTFYTYIPPFLKPGKLSYTFICIKTNLLHSSWVWFIISNISSLEHKRFFHRYTYIT